MSKSGLIKNLDTCLLKDTCLEAGFVHFRATNLTELASFQQRVLLMFNISILHEGWLLLLSKSSREMMRNPPLTQVSCSHSINAKQDKQPCLRGRKIYFCNRFLLLLQPVHHQLSYQGQVRTWSCDRVSEMVHLRGFEPMTFCSVSLNNQFTSNRSTIAFKEIEIL